MAQTSEQGYCSIHQEACGQVTQGVCAQCRATSLAEARRQLYHWHAERLMACLDDALSTEDFQKLGAQEQYYERLVAFLGGDDACDSMVRYVTPAAASDVRAMCEALTRAGALGILVDHDEIVAHWYSKAARSAYEQNR